MTNTCKWLVKTADLKELLPSTDVYIDTVDAVVATIGTRILFALRITAATLCGMLFFVQQTLKKH